MNIEEEQIDLTEDEQEPIKRPFLLCTSCHNHIPPIELVQTEATIVVEINCKHCKQKDQVPLIQYLKSIRELANRNNCCTSIFKHFSAPSSVYCVTCSKWLCYDCNEGHNSNLTANHFRISNEVNIKYNCSEHKNKPYAYYCDDCDESLCKECIKSQQHFHHLIVSKDELLGIVNNLNSQAIIAKYESVCMANKSYKEEVISQTEHLDLGEIHKINILSCYEVNQKMNENILELFSTALSNFNILLQYSSLELLNNIRYLFVFNNTEPKIIEPSQEDNCNNLINYYNNNYFVCVKSKKTYLDGTYEGQLANEKPEGYGVYQWNNKDKFKGQWKNGMKNGKGLMIFADGGTYNGQWIDDNQEGYGELDDNKGYQYKGMWKNGCQNGKGTANFVDGDQYDGNWVNNNMEKGDYQSGFGLKLKGQFTNEGLQGVDVISTIKMTCKSKMVSELLEGCSLYVGVENKKDENNQETDDLELVVKKNDECYII